MSEKYPGLNYFNFLFDETFAQDLYINSYISTDVCNKPTELIFHNILDEVAKNTTFMQAILGRCLS